MAAEKINYGNCFKAYGAGLKNTNVCLESYISLVASPSRFDGKFVAIIGYLKSDFGDLILYPSKGVYESGSNVESIRLIRPFSISEEVLRKAKVGAYPVAVVGSFNAGINKGAVGMPQLGYINNIIKISFSKRIPSGVKIKMDGITVVH
ncbi:hypothetical protein GCM10027285_00030 [Oleiagrimonas citrea]